MKRVALIVFHNIRYAPFVEYYVNLLSKMDEVTYKIIFYNRDKTLCENDDKNCIGIRWYGKGNNSSSKFEKVLNFVIYPFQVKKVLKQEKYDYAIVLMTMPAVLLCNYLINEFEGRFLIDIRDYTQEHFKPYYNREKKLFSKAALRVISSPGYLNFLPKAQFEICHNLDIHANEIIKKRKAYKKAKNRPIIISYIGMISYEKQCRQLIDLVSKDKRFEFHFYGNENSKHIISKHISSVNSAQIKMFGPYQPKDKEKIYEKSDLIFNCYGNKSNLVRYAISNKFYDSALYRKPLLVSPKTLMCELVGNYGYSIELDNAKDLQALYDWYIELNEKQFETFADNIIKKAISENKITEINIRRMILG